MPAVTPSPSPTVSRRPRSPTTLVWEAVAQERDLGDLRIRYWDDPEDLHEKLLAEIDALVSRECDQAGLGLEGWPSIQRHSGTTRPRRRTSLLADPGAHEGSPHGTQAQCADPGALPRVVKEREPLARWRL